MATYFGKRKLTKILYHYLSETAPEKLAELKRELREAGEYRKHKIKYRKSSSREYLEACIIFGGIVFQIDLYTKGKLGKRVTMREFRILEDECGENATKQTFYGYAIYGGDLKPLENDDEKRDRYYCDALLVADL